MKKPPKKLKTTLKKRFYKKITPIEKSITQIKKKNLRNRSKICVISGLKNCTDFEKKVYRAVLGIPKGEVRSYEWVVKKINCSGAQRAVGNALNKNPYPGIIPCHRVIRKDGSIGGFARGVSEKKKLLAEEGMKL